MKYLKKYNEGIFSKAAELLRYNKKADQLIKKYIKMIYDDYSKNEDLFRVWIREHNEYTELEYMITNGSQNDVQLGNRDEDAITIKLCFIENTFKWSNDTTQARLEVSKFKSYQGEIPIVGRNIKTDEIIEDENGIKSNDAISYVNTPSGEVSKIIKFFINQFKSKYPDMTTYFGKRSILEKDPILRDKLKHDELEKSKRERERYEEAKDKEEKFIFNKLENLKMKEDDILDFFIEVEDEVKINISYEKSIFINNTIYYAKFFKFHPGLKDRYKQPFSKLFLTSFSLDGRLNKNRLKFDESDILIKKDTPYHKIIVNLVESYPIDKFKEKIDKVVRRLKFGLKSELSSIREANVETTRNPPWGRVDNYGDYECYMEINNSHNRIYATYIIYLSEI